MPKEWTDDDVKAEIAAAVAIVREDKFEAFVRDKFPKTNDNQGSGNAGTGNVGTGNSGDGQTKPKKSLWWGDPE